MSDKHGFTIIENLIIISMISLIVSTAIPKTLIFIDRQRIDQEAAYLVSELRYLQELSRTVNRQHTDFLSVPSEAAPELVLNRDGYFIKKKLKAEMRHDFPTGMTAIYNRNKVMFSPEGDADPMTITLQYGTQKRDIIIDSVGRIRTN